MSEMQQTVELEQWVSCEPAAIQWEHEYRNWGIYIAGSHNSATASDDKLRRLSMCCGEKSRAWISDSVIITFSYDL
jgi:hypothetical protein